MPERNGRLLRPLLPVSRKDIVEYANRHGLSWVDDESNADIRYSRNFLRHSILPALRQRFPAAESRLAFAAERFSEAANLLDELALMDLGTYAPEFPLPVELLAGLPEARARNVLRFLLNRSGVGIPSEGRLVEAVRQLVEATPDRHPVLRFGDARLIRRKGFVILESGGHGSVV
jgi:tRNA(Ile)-lysidine synthase